MRSGYRIGVAIPALNEAAALGRVIKDIPAWVDQIVVADNGSSDDTAAVARASGAEVVLELERGYGAACQKALAALEMSGVDVVVFLDADYSDDPRQMAALVDPIVERGVDLVIGSRVLGNPERGALLPQQRFGNWVACVLMTFLFGACYTDLGPFRGIRLDALHKLKMKDRKFGWTVEMQVKALRHGLVVQEVPVRYRPRIGKSKISGTLIGTIRAGFAIIRVIVASACAGISVSNTEMT